MRTPEERLRFKIAAGVSGVAWLVLVATCLIAYAVFFWMFIVVGHALFLAWIRGNAVRISPQQLPDLHDRVQRAAKRLGMDQAPECYLLQAEGALNAFASKLFGRRFMLIYSDLVDACEDHEGALDFVIGHEIGHLALGHLKWHTFLVPGRMFPWLGPAYSRACEYSCDRCGLAVAGDLEAASRGIGVLAAGGRLSHRISLDALADQRADVATFWPAIVELNATHPFLSKRIAALREFVQPGSAPAVGRNPIAYPLAPFLGAFGGGVTVGGGMGTILAVVAVIGILAAIAIPNFIDMQYRAKRAEVPENVKAIALAEIAHHRDFSTYVEVPFPVPRDVEQLTQAPAPWVSGSRFDMLGWEPDGDVRGIYWVEVLPDSSDFIVHGLSDIDGDGEVAHFTANDSAVVETLTPAIVY
jgi:Zn-dependent protease with chaperone function